MLTPKENELLLLTGQRPERFVLRYDEDEFVGPGERPPMGQDGPDWFGVPWESDPYSKAPSVKPGWVLFDDIADWREKVVWPDIDAFDWQDYADRFTAHWDRENKLSNLSVMSGHFERMHFLMGFENALCAFYEDPEEVKAFFAAVTDYKLRYYAKVKEYLKPDILCQHDDWGTNKNMFFSPEMWREFIKPEVKKLVDWVHANGMRYEQHSCGCIQPIIGDLIELGVDILQPFQVPANDRKECMARYGNKIIFRGGANNQFITNPITTEEQIRQEVRETLDDMVPVGGFIPVFMVGRGREDKICEDEVKKYPFG